MSNLGFNPWHDPVADAAWEMPVRKLTPERARIELDGAEAMPGGPSRLERLLALARLCVRFSAPDLQAEIAAREAFALLGIEAIDRAGATALKSHLPDASVQALDIERDVLGAECQAHALGLSSMASERGGPRAGAEAESGDGPSYASFGLGRQAQLAGDSAGALELFGIALKADLPESGRILVLCHRVEARWAGGDVDGTLSEAAALAALAEGKAERAYELGLALHYRLLALDRRGEHASAVEAGRDSNYQSFQWGARQASARIGVNTFMTAKHLFELSEWHETELLARLSLQGLHAWSGSPSKADALLLMARAQRRFGNEDAARDVLTRLLDHPDSDQAPEQRLAEAREMLEALPNPV